MSGKLLSRGDAPFSDKVWAKIDEAVVSAAKSQLGGRRLLSVDGPYGLGLKSLPGPDREVTEKAAKDVRLTASGVTPVAMIEAGFRLAARDIAAFEESGLPLSLGAAVAAAISCAQQEDALIFQGSRALGTAGLATADGVQTAKLGAWNEVGAAAEDVIAAVTKLDSAGFHGPYTLALAPERYNLLFRRYPQGNGTELQHIEGIVAAGVVKAAAVKSGGLLIASGPQYAAIVLGQDLTAGFVGPDGRDFEFTVSESLALRLLVPAAVCVLK